MCPTNWPKTQRKKYESIKNPPVWKQMIFSLKTQTYHHFEVTGSLKAEIPKVRLWQWRERIIAFWFCWFLLVIVSLRQQETLITIVMRYNLTNTISISWLSTTGSVPFIYKTWWPPKYVWKLLHVLLAYGWESSVVGFSGRTTMNLSPNIYCPQRKNTNIFVGHVTFPIKYYYLAKIYICRLPWN